MNSVKDMSSRMIYDRRLKSMLVFTPDLHLIYT